MPLDEVCSPANVIQIVNVLDLRFQGQRCELSTLAISHVIISQTVTDVASIAIRPNKYELHMGIRLAYLHLTLGQGHAYLDCEHF